MVHPKDQAFIKAILDATNTGILNWEPTEVKNKFIVGLNSGYVNIERCAVTSIDSAYGHTEYRLSILSKGKGKIGEIVYNPAERYDLAEDIILSDIRVIFDNVKRKVDGTDATIDSIISELSKK